MPRTDSSVSTGRAGSLSRRLLAVCGGLVLALVGLEVLIRVAFPEPPMIDTGSTFLRDQRPKESYRFRSPHGEYDLTVEINSLGFHDVEHRLEPDPSTLRIVVLGDSVPEAIQVPLSQTWWTIAGETLQSAVGRPVEMINLGQGGAGTGKALLLLREYGLGFRPDAVILTYVPGNDPFNDSYRLEDKKSKWPFFRLDPQGNLVQVTRSRWEASTSRMWWPLWRVSHLYRQVGRRVARAKEAGGRKRMVDGYHVFYQGFQAQPPPVWDEAWRVSEALVAEIQREAHAIDGTMMAVLSPMTFQLDDEVWKAILHTYPAMQDHEWDLQRPMGLAGGLFDRLGIPYLDLLPVLEDSSTRSDRIYFEHDPHWTVVGNLVAGLAVGDFLADQLAIAPDNRRVWLAPAAESEDRNRGEVQ